MRNTSEQEYCDSTAPYIWSDNVEEGKRVIYKTRCKQWSCEYCAKINKYQHWLRMVKGVQQLQDRGYQFNFVTITSHESNTTTLQTYKVWQSAWKKLSTRYRRKNAETTTLPASFVYIPELHKDGRIHIHGLFSGQVSERWWKDNSRQCGMGYMCKSDRISEAVQGVNYCLKYVTKDMGQDITIERFRRINYSRNFPSLAKDKTLYTWNLFYNIQAIETLVESAWAEGKDVILNNQAIQEIIYE